MGCGCSNYSGNEYNNAAGGPTRYISARPGWGRTHPTAPHSHLDSRTAGPGLIPGGKGWGRTHPTAPHSHLDSRTGQPWEPTPLTTYRGKSAGHPYPLNDGWRRFDGCPCTKQSPECCVGGRPGLPEFLDSYEHFVG